MNHLTFIKAALYTTIVIHVVLVLFLAASVPRLFIYEPWYVALPLSVWIMHLAKAPFRCPLTQLENKFRAKLGWPKIHGFINHYFLGGL